MRKSKANNILILVTACFMGLCVLLGQSFSTEDSMSGLFADRTAVISTLFRVVLYTGLSFFALKVLFSCMDWVQGKSQRGGCVYRLRKTFFLCWLLLLLCWLPYLIGYFPGIFMGDTGAQISMFFHLPNGVSQTTALLSESQFITNHHPVLHTLMVGGFVKLGESLFHSDNVGIFLYVLLQYSFCSATLAGCITYIKGLGTQRWVVNLLTCLLAFYPTFPRYAVLVSKDAYFAAFVLLFSIGIAEWLRDPESMRRFSWKSMGFCISIFGVLLFRQNGVLVVAFGLLGLLFHYRKTKMRLPMLFLTIFGLGFYFIYGNVLLPAFDITPGSTREVLSIPFQQTARYVTEHGDEVTAEEKEAISAVLDYDTLENEYDPLLSDNVKNTFDEEADEQAIRTYFRTWFSMFCKHPGTYVEATLHNYYGYFYIGKDRLHNHTNYFRSLSENFINTRMNNKGFSFSHLAWTEELTDGLETFAKTLQSLPIASWGESAGFYTWLLILVGVYLVRNKRHRELCVCLPGLAILCACLISPANGVYYFRYSLPLAYMMPLLLGWAIQARKSASQ